MGDVLPIRASPLCSIVMVSYHKGKQCLLAAVSILKMIRIPILHTWKTDFSEPPDDLIVGNDWLCLLFRFIPFYSGVIIVVPFGMIWWMSYWLLFLVVLYSVLYRHRNMSPFQLIGAKVKFMSEVIPLIVAAALHHFLESDFKYFVVLLCCTTYFYAFAHFMHAAYDIGLKDVFLWLAMVLLVHTLNGELLVGALIFCLALSFYRYMRYCAPELPIHRKKEELPC